VTAYYFALLLADGRLPVGAHTQSAGIEPAFQAGMWLEQVPDYLAVRLRTVTEVEAATAVVARHVWSGGTHADGVCPSTGSGHSTRAELAEAHADGVCPSAGSGHSTRAELVEAQADGVCPSTGSGHSTRAELVEALAEVDQAWRARTASDAMRNASDLLGRSYLRLAMRLWDLDVLGGRSWCRPLVIGVMAVEAGLEPAQTARLIGFEDVQTAVAAALKLRPFDPAVGVGWSVAAAELVEQMVERVTHLTEPAGIPATTAPQIEHWAQAHRHSERRLFRA
jgi:urease accessory protein